MPDKPQINRRREEFPTLASGIHLLSHSLGPVPRATRESMLAYYEAWEQHTSEDAWAKSWWEMSAQVGDRIAQILGGQSRFGAGSTQRFDCAFQRALMLRLYLE
jgi:kynureninase